GDTLEWPGGARLNLKEGTVTLADGTKSAAHIELSAADRALLERSLPHHEPSMAEPHAGHASENQVGQGSAPVSRFGSNDHGLGAAASHESHPQGLATSGSHDLGDSGHGPSSSHDFEHSGHAAPNSGSDAPQLPHPSHDGASPLPGPRGGDEWLTGARRRPRDILDDPAQTRWAEGAYSDFLKNSRDIGAISSNTQDVVRGNGSKGFSEEEIAAVKKHVFDTEHPIEDYETGEVVTRKFDADAEIADAWIRLRSGNALPEDHILLEHEIAELTYLQEHPGATYQEAHRAANETYNWQNRVPLNRREDFEGEW
ncbi:hypothetical protein AB0451_39375, partial [Streptomyces sp. NPDC052000]